MTFNSLATQCARICQNHGARDQVNVMQMGRNAVQLIVDHLIRYTHAHMVEGSSSTSNERQKIIYAFTFYSLLFGGGFQ